ncbi:MAG: hypothetical protein KAU28_02945 [Phycisphaerae bacterium]|nr:hypothetical protein [Phycisphaerae bacterium]
MRLSSDPLMSHPQQTAQRDVSINNSIRLIVDDIVVPPPRGQLPAALIATNIPPLVAPQPLPVEIK